MRSFTYFTSQEKTAYSRLDYNPAELKGEVQQTQNSNRMHISNCDDD